VSQDGLLAQPKISREHGSSLSGTHRPSTEPISTKKRGLKPNSSRPTVEIKEYRWKQGSALDLDLVAALLRAEISPNTVFREIVERRLGVWVLREPKEEEYLGFRSKKRRAMQEVHEEQLAVESENDDEDAVRARQQVVQSRRAADRSKSSDVNAPWNEDSPHAKGLHVDDRIERRSPNKRVLP